MRWPTIVAVSIVLSLGLALFAYAQLSDSQTASGTVTVSSTAADLYICEPGATPGPDCGADDSGADEAVFEGLENIRPGEIREWEIRLKNTGTDDLLISAAALDVAESADPGGDCPDGVLQPVLYHPAGSWAITTAGIFIVGKAGDWLNDNPAGIPGFPHFQPADPLVYPSGRHIKIAAGDFEDVELRIQVLVTAATATPAFSPAPTPTGSPVPTGTANCGGNEWDLAWQFTAQ